MDEGVRSHRGTRLKKGSSASSLKAFFESHPRKRTDNNSSLQPSEPPFSPSPPPPRGGSSFRRVPPPPMSLFTPARVLVPFIRPCPPPERRQTGRNVEGYQESSPRVCAQPRSRAASRTRPARLKEQKRRHATLAHTRGLLTPNQSLANMARSDSACSCSYRERPQPGISGPPRVRGPKGLITSVRRICKAPQRKPSPLRLSPLLI